jgi:methyl-accepting chemotaxis protein
VRADALPGFFKRSGKNEMLRPSLRVRLLLPVFALVLAVVVAVTVALVTVEANRVKTDAALSIDRQPNSLQSLFAVISSIILDHAHSSMRLLRERSDAEGEASVGP